MMEYKDRVVHVYGPRPKVRRYLDEEMTLSPKPARVRVRLDNGETLDLTEPLGEHLMRGDRVTLHAGLTPRGSIGPPQKKDC